MCLTTTNTLAYYDTVKNTAEKSFIAKAPGEFCIRVTYFHNNTYQTRLKSLTRDKDSSLFAHSGNGC